MKLLKQQQDNSFCTLGKMELQNYKTLIQELPVRQQAFQTKKKTWEKKGFNDSFVLELNKTLFENDLYFVSREDIFNTKNIQELIVKTIYWGYSSGMRHNYHNDIFDKTKELSYKLLELKNKSNLNRKDFENLIIWIHSEDIKGIGLSTLSKLLYFLEIKINETPCLILDSRLIDIFSKKQFQEFESLGSITYNNAEKHYLNYLKVMDEVSKSIDTDGENLEQFLFMFGGNLKINSDIIG